MRSRRIIVKYFEAKFFIFGVTGPGKTPFVSRSDPSHALREINLRGRFSSRVVRPLELQSNYEFCLFQSILKQLRGTN